MFVRSGEPMWKQSRAATRKAKLKDRRDARKHEDDQKAIVRKRDRFCRFPLCGCRKLGLGLVASPEVSHEKHKGAGGNRSGDRSMSTIMIWLCHHRHQAGVISRHKETLRTRYLTDRQADGPVAWEVDLVAIRLCGAPRSAAQVAEWFEVARETAIQHFEPPTDEQRAILRQLAEMEL